MKYYIFLLFFYSCSIFSQDVEIEKSIQKWKAKLSDENWEIRQTALTELLKIIPTIKENRKKIELIDSMFLFEPRTRELNLDSVIPILMEGLKNRDKKISEVCQWLLKRIGDKGDNYLPTYLTILKDKSQDEEFRYEVIDIVSSMQEKASSAVPVLIEYFQYGNEIKKIQVANAIARIGSVSIPLLIAALQNKDKDTRCFCILTLGYIGDASAVPVLIPLLKDEDEDIRKGTLGAFWNLRSKSEPALPHLIEIVQTSNNEMEIVQAIEAIGAIGPKATDAVPFLIPFLKKPKIQIRTMQAIIEIGNEAAFAIPTVIEIVEDEKMEIDTRRLGIITLVNIGSSDAVADVFTRLIGDENELLALPAAEALGEMRPKAVKSIPTLMEYLKGPNGKIASSVLEAIGTEAVPFLFQGLVNDDSHVRYWSAKALGNIKPPPREAILELMKALNDNNDEVREAAKESIANIKQKTE